MAYFEMSEVDLRIKKVRKILEKENLDFAIIYYDELNVANAWYLTAWCPQFESGCVLVPREGEAMILGGPESEPFAKMDSAIKETRNMPVFMVPDEEYPNATIIDFKLLFDEISKGKKIKRVGVVGMDKMPVSVYQQISENFMGVDLIDITLPYLKLRYIKSRWEIEQMRKSFEIARIGYDEMIKAIKPGAYEYEVSAAGNFAVEKLGASGYGFKTVVGSGPRSNGVVPTPRDKIMKDGELCLIGISPRWNGYSGVIGGTIPVGGKLTPAQDECMKYLNEGLCLTRELLKPGMTGREIDKPARALFKKAGFIDYLICPFAHTIGINEAEQPFFGPNGDDPIEAGMTVAIDVSFFGHPVFNGVRVETGYEITEKGAIPFDKDTDKMFSKF
ncbi:MAG: M24 family metallopeptidase [Saccharofermentanales bacterium]